jgi:hypothetical protein
LAIPHQIAPNPAREHHPDAAPGGARTFLNGPDRLWYFGFARCANDENRLDFIPLSWIS